MDSNQEIYKQKYLKYKKKYLVLKTEIDKIEGAGFFDNIAKGVSNLGKGLGIDPARDRRTKDIKEKLKARINQVTLSSSNKNAQKIIDKAKKSFESKIEKEINKIYKKAYDKYKVTKSEKKLSKAEKDLKFKEFFSQENPEQVLDNLTENLTNEINKAVQTEVKRVVAELTLHESKQEKPNEEDIKQYKIVGETGLPGLEKLLPILDDYIELERAARKEDFLEDKREEAQAKEDLAEEIENQKRVALENKKKALFQ